MKTTLGKHGSPWGVLTAMILGFGASARAGDVVVDNLTVNFDLSVKAASTNTTAPTNGLVFYYSFSTNSDPIVDDSGLGHTGTVYGATYTNSGISGGAYAFNGGEYITSPSSTNFDFGSGNFTWAAWLKLSPEVDVYGTDVRRIFSRGFVEGGNGEGTWSWGIGHIYSWGSGIRLNLFYRSGGFYDVISDELSVSGGEWCHVAVVRDGSTVTFYLNANAVGGGWMSGTLSNDEPLQIGWRLYGEYFQGDMDEIRIYNRALSQEEVGGLYYSVAQTTNGTVRFETGVAHLRPLGDVSMGVYTNQP